MARHYIIVGLSGGVDSSVAALLLKQQGHEVLGLFMKNWEDDDTEADCPSRQDLIDAVAVADRLGLDIEVVNFSAEYKERVFSNFLAEYQAGRTPNPDVLCNAEIKFRAFLDHAMGLGADYIATGHYARLCEREGTFELHKASDRGKDQSYFLYRLNQAQLSRVLFPIGSLSKREVREIARREGLPTHAKKDSTGICFIGERPFREFLGRYLPRDAGPIQTLDGQVVGQHDGLMFYTVGQRRGLGIGGPGKPWFVAEKDLIRNTLLVVQGHDHPALFKDKLIAGDLTWISGSAPSNGTRYAAKTRYRQADAACSLTDVRGEALQLDFVQPQWAITPGQSAVLYRDDVCLGGGIIRHYPHPCPSP